jgi:hypothetical protein
VPVKSATGAVFSIALSVGSRRANDSWIRNGGCLSAISVLANGGTQRVCKRGDAMSMEMRVEGQGLLVARIHGILRRSELDEGQGAAAKMIRQVGKISALILLEGFQGWERRDEWSDMSFLFEHDNDIEKIALVGQEKWRDEALMFAGAGLRHSAVRYFNDADEARAWLAGRPS